MIEKTFAILKPDTITKKNTGKIIDLIEDNGFNIIRMQKITMTPAQAQTFYDIHKDRPFFNELVSFMTSGPIVIMVLEKENAIKAWRDLMGDTNPANAKENTIRKLFGASIGENAVHGSDSANTAKREIAQFFPELI